MRKNDFASAKKALNKANALRPEDPYVAYDFAYIDGCLGLSEKAIAGFEDCIKKIDEIDDIIRIENLIDKLKKGSKLSMKDY
jgi:tetratricopeptide (TPR) repeat protein